MTSECAVLSGPNGVISKSLWKPLKFDRFHIGSIGSSMRRIVSGDLTRFEIKEIKSFVRRRLRDIEHRKHVLLRKTLLRRDRDGPRNGGHRSAESLRLLQKRIESVRRVVRLRRAWERARRHRRLLRPRGSRPRQCVGGERRAETRNELPSLHECRPTPKDYTLTHRPGDHVGL